MTMKNQHFIASGLTARLFNKIRAMSAREKEELLRHLGNRVRESVRKQYIMEIDIKTENTSFREFITNISTGGVNVANHHQLSIGEQILLSLPFPHLNEPLELLGEVVRKDQNGIGVMFKQLNDGQINTLEQIMDNL